MPGFAWSWLEDETLFSWCARFHRCCPWSARTTARQLFGCSGAVKSRTAPSSIDHFVRSTKGLLGDAASILRMRSVAGLYTAPATGQSLRADPILCSNHKYGALTGLRYCASCLLEHRKAYGTGLWRIGHQLPGAAVCVSHGEPLRWVSRARFAWYLPEDLPARSMHFESTAELQTHCVASAAIRHFFHIADADVGVLVHSAVGLLCEHYRVLDGKRLDPTRLEEDWRRSHMGAWVAREAPSLKCCRPGWIADMLRGRRSERNPLRWAYLAAFLKELGLAEPEDLFVERHSSDAQIGLWEIQCGVSGAVLDAFGRSHSFADVARSLNVAVHTARRWARLHPALQRTALAWGTLRQPRAVLSTTSDAGICLGP